MTDKHEPFKFTLPALRALKPANKSYKVTDTGQPGLSCRVLVSGVKTLLVYKRPKGSNRPIRVKICNVGELPLDGTKSVRSKARDILSDLEKGINPNIETRKKKALESAEAMTLRQGIEGYIKIANIKPKTASEYKALLVIHVPKWLDLPLKTISGSMITVRHKEISKEYPVTANKVMRVIRILFNHYRLEFEDDTTGISPIPASPTRKLRKRWNHETRRQTYVKPGNLKDWWKATEAIAATHKGKTKDQVPVYQGDGELARDYLQFDILSGLRKSEISTKMDWPLIDLKNKTFVVENTKNKDPLELPLSDYMIEILKRREKATQRKEPPFNIKDVRKLVQWVRDKSKVHFTVQDLRRTFITYAESKDFGAYTLKALINHRSGGDPNDVTAGYVVITTERLRNPMQQITDYILESAGVKETEVVNIKDKAA